MTTLDEQIEKTKKITDSGIMKIDRGCVLKIENTIYQVILENQLVILETLKSLNTNK